MSLVITVKKREWIKYLIALYVIFLSTYGFSKAFFHVSILTDIGGVLIIISVVYITKLKNDKTNSQRLIKLLILVFCIACGFVAVISSYSIRLSILGFRNYVLYLLFGVSVSIINSKKDYIYIIDIIERVGVTVCLFSICQFLFFEHLPSSLLFFPGAKFEGIYGLYSTTIFRVNGLLENTIVFGSFSSVISMIILAKICTYRDRILKREYVYLVISYVATILTFGRFAIAGCFACSMLTYYLAGKTQKLGRGLKLFIAFITIAVMMMVFFRDTVIMTRLLGRGESTITSNRIHQLMAMKGISVLKNNWILGIGMGTQGYIRGDLKAIITDGGWIAMMLETGIPLTIEFISIMFLMNRYALNALRRTISKESTYINSLFVSITVFYLLAGFFNSSFPALCNYGIYWIIGGCMLGLNRIIEKEG